VVGDVALALGALGPVDIQADLMNSLLLGQFGREIVAGVGDDGDAHERGTLAVAAASTPARAHQAAGCGDQAAAPTRCGVVATGSDSRRRALTSRSSPGADSRSTIARTPAPLTAMKTSACVLAARFNALAPVSQKTNHAAKVASR